MVSDADREEALRALDLVWSGHDAESGDLPGEHEFLDALIALGWSKGEKPVADREALVVAVQTHHHRRGFYRGGDSDQIVCGCGWDVTAPLGEADMLHRAHVADALLAPDGPLRSEAQVKAEALEEAGDVLDEPYRLWSGLYLTPGGRWERGPNVRVTEIDALRSASLGVADWLRARAAEIREGR